MGGETKQRGSGQDQTARIWVLEDEKNLRPVTIRTGLNDNRYLEITGGSVKEGDDVVVGIVGGESSSTPAQSNPFQPRMPGGGGGGRRGF